MSNLTLFTESGNLAIPEYLREADETTKMLAGSGGKSISIKGGVWRMIVGGEEVAKNEDRSMRVIIVAAAPKTHRTFYMNKYEEGANQPPTCWSADGIKPNAEVPEANRQNATCAGCPQNIAGSGEGESRACRYSRRLAVVLENDIEGNVYRLQLPAKSLFGRAEGNKMPLEAYAKFLAGHNVPITGVVTEMRFDTAEAVPVVRFSAVRPLERHEWEAARAAAQSPDALQAIEFKLDPSAFKADDTQAAAQAPAPAPAPAPRKSRGAAQAAPAPAPAADPAWTDAPTEDPAPAPVARSAKPAAPAQEPATPSDLPNRVAAVLAAWSDDDDE